MAPIRFIFQSIFITIFFDVVCCQDNDNGVPTSNDQQPIQELLVSINRANEQALIEATRNMSLGMQGSSLLGGMEMDPEQPIRWTDQCDQNDETSKLVIADLDPVIERSGFGLMEVGSPLKALFTVFLLRSGAGSTSSAGRNLVQRLLMTTTDQELLATYVNGRENIVPSGAFPQEFEMECALKEWVEHCPKTRNSLFLTGFRPITMEVPKAIEILSEEEKIGMQTIFAKAPGILEKVRAKVVHRKSQFIGAKRVILGDSSAHQLLSMWKNSSFIGVSAEGGPVSEVIRAFDGVALSSSVRWMIVMVGKDSLVRGESVDAIMEQINRLLNQCTQFGHVQIFWIPPPFVLEKKAQYEELIGRMRTRFRAVWGDKVQLVTTTDSGRSILEIFRYGDGHNIDHVTAKGLMTEKGKRLLRAWLTSQVEGFPGNRIMMESAGHVNRARGGPTRSRTSSSRGSSSRAHPYWTHDRRGR